MKEEDLKALEEAPDQVPAEEAKAETTTEEDKKSEGTSEGETTEEGTEENKEPQYTPEELEIRKKRTERQGIAIGGIFSVLLIICLGLFIYYQLTKSNLLGIKPSLRFAKEEEVKEVEVEEPVKKKDLADPSADTGDVEDDVDYGEFQTKAYIPVKKDSDRWFYCASCKKLANSKFIFLDINNDVYTVLNDGYLYEMETNGYDAYTLFEIHSTRKFTKIFDKNLYMEENGVFYSLEYDEEDKEYGFRRVNKSTLLNTISKSFRLDAIYPFRPNINDDGFSLSENYRYYGFHDDKVYLINDDGTKGELLFVLGNDEDLVYISGNVIKTTKMFYSIQCIEKEDGYDYKFYPDSINKYYSQIKYYNGNIVVTNEDKVYFYGTPIE